MSEWDCKVFAKEEIKMESTTTSDIYKVQDGVKMQVQIVKLNEKNARRRMLHDLRMSRQYTVG